MNFIRASIQQPVSVTVGVILILMAGLIALQRIPIQLTPNVEDTIIAVSTHWEGASPEEIEQEIVDEQEEKLQGLTNLRTLTSQSTQGQAQIRLEFNVGTSKDVALREVSDKLREVPEYPADADEPVVEASDPNNQDYIAWIILSTTDPNLEIRTLRDFAEDHIKPIFERVPGVSEVNVLGGREREAQIRVDLNRLAQYGITPGQLANAIRDTNRNVSAGEISDAKSDVRLRTVSQYSSPEEVEDTVIAQTANGPVFVRDVATVIETYKEASGFVRSKGRPVIAINAQKEVGSNVMEVMKGLKAAMAQLNASNGALAAHARKLDLEGGLTLTQAYDQTIYIEDALALVRNNIWLGGGLAVLVLLLFLRSLRSVGIIALAIPISVIGAVVVMVAMGRTINVVSLAGMAFAIGLVVDNAIVVLENIFRHLEMGKNTGRAAYDGAREVWGAILASTLTTIFVFIPILLIEEEAGQLFRDIALAICAAVGLSLIVSIAVIPSAAGLILKPMRHRERKVGSAPSRARRIITAPLRAARSIGSALHRTPELIGALIYRLLGSTIARLAIVVGLTALSLIGSWFLMPPADYLPQGNRNLIFGMLIPPPGYNVEMQTALAHRIEDTVAPFFEAGALKGTDEYEEAKKRLPQVPTFDMRRGQPGDPVVPPPLVNYFVVGAGTRMFHGGISAESSRVVDVQPLFMHATRSEVVPGVMGFAFQVPLFRLGGSSGSAIEIDFSGDDLGEVTNAASAIMMELMQKFGGGRVQPSPTNFNIFGPELQVIPNRRALADVGMTPIDLALAVQAAGDGALIGDYRRSGETIDLKLIADDAVDRTVITDMLSTPIATPIGAVVPISSLAEVRRVVTAPQINHVGRQRSVTLQFTPPPGLALENAVNQIQQILAENEESGTIPAGVETNLAGSASKLQNVQRALLGDGTILGTLNSSLVLALIVTYLVLAVLFQSFLTPLVIMFSVPLATLGGFAALRIVYLWSLADRYLPVQTMDVLTMLGFVILIGVVVNNAILIVHQSLNFMRGKGDVGEGISGPLPTRRAIAEAVRTRVRPIFMSTLTSVGAMLPLVLMPGSGSELYRGLGSVVTGGLLVSTIFTLFLVPMLLSLVFDFLPNRQSATEEAVSPEPAPVPKTQRPTREPVAAADLMTPGLHR